MAMSHAMSSGSDATRHTSTTAYTTKNDKRENKRDDRRKIKTGFSLLSLSDKSAVDVVGDLDVDDCATGGHFALCAPSRRVRWVDFGVMEWGVMRAASPMGCYDCVRVVES